MTNRKTKCAERIVQALIATGMKQSELCRLTGIPKSAMSQYIKGSFEPKQDRIYKIAEALRVSEAWLMGFDVPMKKTIYGESNISAKGFKIPVLGYVRAGIPIEAVEDILDYEEISLEMASQGEHFALSIKGDSMEPRIAEGDVVIVRKQNIVENGELAVVLVNGNDATVKKFYMNDNGVTLISTNPIYDPFYYSKEDVEKLPVQVIGKVVELRAKF